MAAMSPRSRSGCGAPGAPVAPSNRKCVPLSRDRFVGEADSPKASHGILRVGVVMRSAGSGNVACTGNTSPVRRLDLWSVTRVTGESTGFRGAVPTNVTTPKEIRMTRSSIVGRATRIVAAAAIAVVAAVGARMALASDHQDTPEVELNPRMDINDVYAFPGASADRVALVMTTSSPIAGQSASFDPELLYQFRIDNSGDAVEDRVIQVTFDQGTGANQRFFVRGPVAPTTTGMKSSIVQSADLVTGFVGSNGGSASGVLAFAGLRADPFVIDLEQFFNIIPDRRPSTGPLSGPATPTATQFRNPGVDFLRPFNTLAIVVEVPRSLLTTNTAPDARIGVWGTISR
jgi:hypothetical protein